MQRPEAGPRPRLRGGRVVIVKDRLLCEVTFLDFLVQRTERAELESVRRPHAEPELHQRRMLRVEPESHPCGCRTCQRRTGTFVDVKLSRRVPR